MYDLKTYESIDQATWCPGCGDFGIIAAVKQALVQLELAPHQVMFFSGIGCGSKLPHYVKANGFNALHGRGIPVATGFHLANTDLKIIHVSGDGDSYGIGANHLLNAARRNVDMLQLVENNQIYALTKGQYSPTSDKGFITTTTPEGSIEVAVNPLAMALAAGATFIARAFANDVKYLATLIARGVTHKGYALIDVLQPCVTYNHINTKEWYRLRIYKVEDEQGYSPSDREYAFRKATEWGERIPVGVIYESTRPTYEDEVTVLKNGPLARQPLHGPTMAEDFEKTKREFM
jgi:2-oxoglutarate ferredoxin oxidoreductase subunit beta